MSDPYAYIIPLPNVHIWPEGGEPPGGFYGGLSDAGLLDHAGSMEADNQTMGPSRQGAPYVSEHPLNSYFARLPERVVSIMSNLAARAPNPSAGYSLAYQLYGNFLPDIVGPPHGFHRFQGLPPHSPTPLIMPGPHGPFESPFRLFPRWPNSEPYGGWPPERPGEGYAPQVPGMPGFEEFHWWAPESTYPWGAPWF